MSKQLMDSEGLAKYTSLLLESVIKQSDYAQTDSTKSDFIKNKPDLDAIQSSLRNELKSYADGAYTVATSDTPGLVKPESVINTPNINNVSTTNGKYYHVQMDTVGKMFVNVPWSNTNYYHTPSYDSGLNISTGSGIANMYVPTAGAESLGVVRGFHRTSGTATGTKTTTATNSPVINSRTTTSGRYYGVETDANGYMFVNVPWSDSDTDTNTNYYHTTGSWSGLTYTAKSNGGAGELKFTIPTGTTASTVAAGNHTHEGVKSNTADLSFKGYCYSGTQKSSLRVEPSEYGLYRVALVYGDKSNPTKEPTGSAWTSEVIGSAFVWVYPAGQTPFKNTQPVAFINKEAVYVTLEPSADCSYLKIYGPGISLYTSEKPVWFNAARIFSLN